MTNERFDYTPGWRDKFYDLRWQVLHLWRKYVGRLVDWPPAPGHFRLGNSASAVAICTLSSTALIDQLDTDYTAIIGRVYTPNIGIEKMIRNVVSNPKLRYLVLCGKESPVFKVGEALLMLQTNGLDANGKIIGATAPNAELVNIPRETVTTFLQQITLLDFIGVVNPAKIASIAKELHNRQTPPFVADTSPALHNTNNAPLEITAQRRHWLELDPLGYFIINLERERQEIAVERYTADKKLTHIIRGRAADLLYHAIIREKLVSQLDHAAYLGAELAKAETALYLNLPYEQDKKLRLPETGPKP